MMAVGETYPGQTGGPGLDLHDRPVDDGNTQRVQLLALLVGQRRSGVLEKAHVRAELVEQQRLVHGHRAGREHADAAVADLPAVAVGAVQYIGAPPLGEARDVGQLVAQAGRD